MDRFDLETAITDCWRVSDDLDLMLEEIIDGAIDAEFNCDSVHNALLGIKELHNRRCQKLWAVFDELLQAGKISN
jgi:hypothetical protein